MLREEAYKLVQAHAMSAWETEGDFRKAIEEDPRVARYLDVQQRDYAFSLERQLSNVSSIFSRVFGRVPA